MNLNPAVGGFERPASRDLFNCVVQVRSGRQKVRGRVGRAAKEVWGQGAGQDAAPSLDVRQLRRVLAEIGENGGNLGKCAAHAGMLAVRAGDRQRGMTGVPGRPGQRRP